MIYFIIYRAARDVTADRQTDAARIINTNRGLTGTRIYVHGDVIYYIVGIEKKKNFRLFSPAKRNIIIIRTFRRSLPTSIGYRWNHARKK